MITKKDIEIFNIEVDARIYKLEVLKSELELELINNIMEGKDATGVQYQFDNIKAEIKDLKDIKLDANCKYREVLCTHPPAATDILYIYSTFSKPGN